MGSDGLGCSMDLHYGKKLNCIENQKPPGYLGGYDWRATGTGLVALAIVNFIATQYIAAKFHYQPALGAPLIRNHRMAVYQPLAWTVWGWKHATSKDERIRRPFLRGGNDRGGWKLSLCRSVFRDHQPPRSKTFSECG